VIQFLSLAEIIDCHKECCCSVPELTAGAVVATVSVSKTDPPDVLDRQKCLAALAEQRRTKWFQVRFRLHFLVSSV
jgi:DZF domain